MKKRFITAIPFNRYTSIKIKNEALKLGINIPIKPNSNIFQQIRKDRDSINPLETSGIYKLEFINENNKTGSYIGMTKRKIKDRIKEHPSDISHNRQTPALAQLNTKKKIKIYFNVKKNSTIQ